jgi:hypothetical protein
MRGQAGFFDIDERLRELSVLIFSESCPGIFIEK